MLVTNYICRATILVFVLLSMIRFIWIVSKKKKKKSSLEKNVEKCSDCGIPPYTSLESRAALLHLNWSLSKVQKTYQLMQRGD